jgi:hypothetical protein
MSLKSLVAFTTNLHFASLGIPTGCFLHFFTACQLSFSVLMTLLRLERYNASRNSDAHMHRFSNLYLRLIRHMEYSTVRQMSHDNLRSNGLNSRTTSFLCFST